MSDIFLKLIRCTKQCFKHWQSRLSQFENYTRSHVRCLEIFFLNVTFFVLFQTLYFYEAVNVSNHVPMFLSCTDSYETLENTQSTTIPIWNIVFFCAYHVSNIADNFSVLLPLNWFLQRNEIALIQSNNVWNHVNVMLQTFSKFTTLNINPIQLHCSLWCIYPSRCYLRCRCF